MTAPTAPADPTPWACPVCREASEPLIRAETLPGEWHNKRHRFLFGGWRAWQVCPACGAAGASGTGWTLEAALVEARRQTTGAQNRARSVAGLEDLIPGDDEHELENQLAAIGPKIARRERLLALEISHAQRASLERALAAAAASAVEAQAEAAEARGLTH